MSSIIKKLIPTATKSLQDDLGTPLDLSYITDKILVCSCPVSTFPKVLYRNSLNDLINFLEIYHSDHWSIWNFKAEDTDDYSFKHKQLEGKVNYFPWPDHQAPSFQLLLDSINSIHQFLEKDKKNVAVLHCKMGKGRSGLISAAYLMIYQNSTKEQACYLFTTKRMNPGFGEGVSILSQLRYLSYCSLYKVHPYCPEFVARIDRLRILFDEGRNQHLRRLSISIFFLNIENAQNKVLVKSSDLVLQTKENAIYHVDQPLKSQDFRVLVDSNESSSVFPVSTSFNVYWEIISLNKIPEKDLKGVLKVKWMEMDGFRGTQLKGKRLFDKIEIYFTLV